MIIALITIPTVNKILFEARYGAFKTSSKLNMKGTMPDKGYAFLEND